MPTHNLHIYLSNVETLTFVAGCLQAVAVCFGLDLLRKRAACAALQQLLSAGGGHVPLLSPKGRNPRGRPQFYMQR